MRRGALERADRPVQAALTARAPGLELRAVERDERELARHEEAGADREDQADEEQRPFRHDDHRRA